MKRAYIFLILPFICNCSLAQQPNCNRAVRVNHLKSKLDSSICIPIGYQIIDIYDDVDLNSDKFEDKIVRWQRTKLVDGDTIYYSIYITGKDGKLQFYRRLDNLRPLYFKNYEYHYKTGNKFYDSIKTNYSYPTLTEVEFENNTISIVFYTEAATIKKLFFTYSPKEKTWILTREMQWLVPPKNYEGDEKLDENGRKLEYDRTPNQPMRIDDFDMLKYIGW